MDFIENPFFSTSQSIYSLNSSDRSSFILRIVQICILALRTRDSLVCSLHVWNPGYIHQVLDCHLENESINTVMKKCPQLGWRPFVLICEHPDCSHAPAWPGISFILISILFSLYSFHTPFHNSPYSSLLDSLQISADFSLYKHLPARQNILLP